MWLLALQFAALDRKPIARGAAQARRLLAPIDAAMLKRI
jgi:hypothetical protein